MSDISGQLIKDSYSYILQADTSTGYVYRVNGNVPVNPIFSSGLTVFSAFTYVDGNQSNGYVLTSDGAGNASWAAVSGASVSSVTAGSGLSGNSTTGAITLINTAPDQTVIITGGTNIQIVSDYPNFGINFTGTTSSSGDYLPLSGGTVTGDTIFQSGLTANTLTITGLTSSTDSNVVTVDGSGILHTYPISGLTGNTFSGNDGASSGRWILDNTTTPPTTGKFYTTATDITGITSIDISYTANTNTDYAGWFNLIQFWKTTTAYVYVTIEEVGNNSNISLFYVSSIIDNASYFTINLSSLPIPTGSGILNNTSEYTISFVNSGPDGATGAPGPQGNDGANSGRWTFTTSSTAFSNPGSGKFNSDSSDFSLITGVSISYEDYVTTILYGWLSVLRNSQISGYTPILQIRDLSEPNNVGTYTVGTIVDNTTWFDLPLTLISSNGYLSDNSNYSISWVLNGKNGTGGGSGDYLPLSGGTVTGVTNFTDSIKVTGVTSEFYTDNLVLGFDVPILRINNAADYPIEIFLTDEPLTYPAPIGSIGNNNNGLHLKYGSVDTDWGKFVYQNSDGDVLLPIGLTANTISATTASIPTITTSSVQNTTTYRFDMDPGSGYMVIYNNGHETKFYPSGPIEIPGNIIGGSYGGNQVQLGSSATLAGLRNNEVYIQTGTGGTADNTFKFGANTFYSPVISATTYLNLPTGQYLPLSGGTVTGNTIFQSGLTATTISATTYSNLPSQSGTGISAFSYNQSTGLLTITKNDTNTLTAGTFSYITATTLSAANVLSVASNGTSATTTTINAVTGGTYSNGTITLSGTGSVNGNTITGFPTSLTGAYLPLSGGTMTGGIVANSGVTANTISQTQYIDFTTGSTNPSSVAGRVFFDTTSKALSYFDISNNQVPIAMGQQLYTRVWNATGVQIDKGKVIAITGTSNNLPSAILAVNTHGITSARPIGLAAENIPNGSEGLVLNNGILSGITINGFANGDTLYLSDTTPGGYVASTAALSFTARTNEIGYVLQTGSSIGKIYVNINNEDSNLSLTDKERNILEGNVISGGVYEYTGMTQGAGQTINVAYVRGWVVKNTYAYATLPDVTNIYYTGGTNIALTYLATADATYILINSASTLVQQTTFPTPQQRRENIFLGKVVHPNRSTITSVNQTVDFDVSPMAALRDLWTPLKLINQGVVVSYYSAGTMNIQTSAGSLWGNGIGWYTNQLNPDSVSISGTSPTTFQYRSRNGSITGSTSNPGDPPAPTGNTTTIDAHHYDDNGSIVAVGGNNRATNQRVYLFPTGLIRIQYGQFSYSTMANAIAGIDTEVFVEFSNNRDNGILIGILTVREDASDLSITTDAQFRFVSKFGELLGGAGGISTTTLQQAYDNSAAPEILTNSTLGALHIKNGTGNADNVSTIFETLNAAGVSTAFMRADGLISGSSLSAPTISGTTFYGLPTYISATTLSSSNVLSVTSKGGSPTTTTINAVTGGTYSSGTLTLSGTGNFAATITGFNTGTITGSGTSGYLSKFASTTAIGDSGFYDNGSGTFGSYGTTGGPANAFVAVRSLAAVTTNYTGGSVGSYVRVGFNSPYTGNSTGVIEVRSAGGSSTSPLSLNPQGGNVIIGSLTDDGYKLDVNGTTRITNTLTVTATTDPVKFVNVQTSTDTEVLTIDGTGVVHKIASSSLGGGSLTWNNATTATTATTNNGYVGTATTLTTITLPTGATFGSIIEVVGTGTGLWRISQNANQFIKFGITGTTTGTGGYLSATSQYDCVKLLCTSANTAFVVTSAIGNIFYN